MRDMTTGSPVKKILAFLVPVLMGNLLQQFYSLADSMVVSRFLGVDAFAGVSATGSLSFLVLGFTWGITAGCAIPVAQEFGAKDYAGMRRCFANALWLCAFTAVVLAAATGAATGWLLSLLGTPENIFGYASSYIRAIFIGIPASMAYNLFSGVMRAVGDGRTPLFMLLFSSLLNIALDLLFVIAFGFGIAGAAWATVLSQAASAVLCWAVIRRKFDILRIGRADMAFDGSVVRRLAGTGLPMGLQFSITAIGSTVLQSAVNSLGSSAVAAVGAGAKVQFLFNAPIDAVGTTMATYCGQNKGARRYDRVKKGVLEIALVMCGWCLFAFAVQKLAGRDAIRLFIGDAAGAQLIDDTAVYLNTVTMFSFTLAFIMIFRNAIQGMGYSRPAMLAGFMEVGGRLFAAKVLIREMGFTGACFANPAAWVCADALLIPMFFILLKKAGKVENRIGEG